MVSEDGFNIAFLEKYTTQSICQQSGLPTKWHVLAQVSLVGEQAHTYMRTLSLLRSFGVLLVHFFHLRIRFIHDEQGLSHTLGGISDFQRDVDTSSERFCKSCLVHA